MLPDLPKQIKKREAKSSLKFKKWLKTHPQKTCAYEMKDTKGKNSLPFSAVEDDQLVYGRVIKSNQGVLIRVQGSKGEPDYIYLRNSPSYIVIKYPAGFVIIDIEVWISEKQKSDRKSLTFDRAVEIGHLYSF